MKYFILSLIIISNSCVFGQKLQVHPSGKYLEYKDGQPFLWLGDTAWELFHKLNREEASVLVPN
jgi:hypothetical protein